MKSAWFRIAAWVVFVLIATIVMSLMCWDWLSSNGESGSSTMRNIVLMAAAVIALPLAIWRSIVVERQADTARKQAETAQQGLLNERYQKGAEMLGNEVLSVRLGGIYALRRLAEEHPEIYHIQVMQLFCAFARHPTIEKDEETKLSDGKGKGTAEKKGVNNDTRLRQDVEAVMVAIGSRSCKQRTLEYEEKFKLDLRGAVLSGANLEQVPRLNFSNADLRGADLSRAAFLEPDLSSINLRDADLCDASLPGANLVGAFLWGAKLSKADLWNADMSHSILWNADVSGAKLTDTILSETKFSGDTDKQVSGLTQTQLNEARAHPNRPPRLNSIVDAETGKPLVWRGKSIGRER